MYLNTGRSVLKADLKHARVSNAGCATEHALLILASRSVERRRRLLLLLVGGNAREKR